MERIRNVVLLIFDIKCDLDFGDRVPIVALCTTPHNGDYLCQVILKTFQRFKNYGADTK